MKHSVKLLSFELNRYCDYYQIQKENFNEESISIFCRNYRSKFNFFYNDMKQIEKDLKKLISI